ncbi:MAG: DUF4115 domain-containing protein [Elusimicrobia bacterium]|nr:DUF4115 domain-containing protein [Elusimicrobiota bacterium]
MPDHDPLRRIPPRTVPSALEVDIGTILKAARLKKGQAVDVVSQHTRVPKKLVEALEANRLDEFPAMVYLRGFLKIYCDYLDVDFEPLWKQIVPDQPAGPGPSAQGPCAPASPAQSPSAPAASHPRSAPAANAFPEGRPARSASGDRAGGPAKRVGEEMVGARQGGDRLDRAPAGAPVPAAAASSLPIGALAALAAALLLIAWLAMRKPAPEAHGPGDAPAPPPVLQPITKPLEPVVSLAFKRDVWVQVAVDDKVRFEGIVPARAKPQEYKPLSRLSIRTPAPSDIVLTLNGAPTDFPKADASGEYVIPVR